MRDFQKEIVRGVFSRAAEPARRGGHLDHPDHPIRQLARSNLASVGELSRSYHDRVAGFAPGTDFEEGS